MFTKLERERYNEDRARACKRLNITKNQYNWLRRKGEALHRVYENSCNGKIAEDAYDLLTGDLEKEIEEYISGGEKYFVYYQTDPRGATIYLDTKAIPANNYTQAVCIY
jgi:hypothetical protein